MNHSSKCSLERSGVNFEDQNQSNKKWPLWLPSEWLIHRDTNTQQVYYSNPRGQAFYSEEEVIQYLAKENQKRDQKKLATKKRTNRKIIEPKHEPEKKAKVVAETTAAVPCLDDHPEWPAWLPHDWFIERDCENPSAVYYCSPKWKKFRTKDEVLQHVAKKPTTKRVKKIHESKDSSVSSQQ